MTRSRDIEVKVRVNKEGQLNVFRDMAEEVGELAPAAQEAERAVDKLGSSVENNFRGSFRATTNAKFALEQYQKQIQAIQAAGGVVSPEQLARLEQLESRYDGLIGTVGEYRAAHQRTSDEVKEATAAAGGHGEAIRSLDDLIEQLAGRLGSGAAKWAAWGTAAVGAFTVGFKAGQKLRDVLNEITGGDFDRNVQESFAGIAKAIAGTADEASLLQNQMNVLAKNGIDVAGKSAEEVGQLYEEFTGKLRENAKEVANAEAAYAAWREELGPVADDLDKTAEALLANIENLRETEQQLSDSEFAALVKPQVDALVAEYERLGEEPPEHIKALIEELEGLVAATGDATEEMGSQWGTTKDEIQKAVDELRKTYSPIPDDLAKQAEAVGVSVNAWERHNDVFTVAGEPQKWDKFKRQVTGVGEEMKKGGKKAEDHGTKVAEAAGKVGEFSKPGSEAATAASDLGKGMGEAATEAGKVAKNVKGLGSQIKTDFQAAQGFEQPVLDGVARIEAAVDQAVAKVDKLKQKVTE